jgi:hypothetical protein
MRAIQCVGVQEVFYNRYIVKKDLFKGVMKLLERHLHRNNLINSAIIELFDYIRIKNVKELIKYMVDKYRTLYEKLDYVDTYKMLIVKYDQNEQYDKVPSLHASMMPCAVCMYVAADRPPRHAAGVSISAPLAAWAQLPATSGGMHRNWIESGKAYQQDAANGLTTGASGDSHSWGARDGPRRGGGRGRGLGSFRSRLEEDDDEDYFNQDDDDDGPEHGPPAPANQSAPQDEGKERESEAPMGLAALGDLLLVCWTCSWHSLRNRERVLRVCAPGTCDGVYLECLQACLLRPAGELDVTLAGTGAYEEDEEAEGSPRKREDQDGEGEGDARSDAKRARR